MKIEVRILVAFLLNLAFSVFEFAGGLFTGSIAIISDAVHDLGDAAGIGLSYVLERKSRRGADTVYSYGYGRFSVLGGVLASLILLLGSALVIRSAAERLLHPVPIRYDGMILFALVGVCVNFGAAWFTHGGDSLNQRAINLHMLEDVLGWAVVLVGAVVMHFTDLTVIDPLMSMGVALFILTHAAANLKEAAEILLDKVPAGMDTGAVRAALLALDGVSEVHALRIRSTDGLHNCAEVHLICDAAPHTLKEQVRCVLRAHGIGTSTLELYAPGEPCPEEHDVPCGGHHHHTHPHHHH